MKFHFFFFFLARIWANLQAVGRKLVTLQAKTHGESQFERNLEESGEINQRFFQYRNSKRCLGFGFFWLWYTGYNSRVNVSWKTRRKPNSFCRTEANALKNEDFPLRNVEMRSKSLRIVRFDNVPRTFWEFSYFSQVQLCKTHLLRYCGCLLDDFSRILYLGNCR